ARAARHRGGRLAAGGPGSGAAPSLHREAARGREGVRDVLVLRLYPLGGAVRRGVSLLGKGVMRAKWLRRFAALSSRAPFDRAPKEGAYSGRAVFIWISSHRPSRVGCVFPAAVSRDWALTALVAAALAVPGTALACPSCKDAITGDPVAAALSWTTL